MTKTKIKRTFVRYDNRKMHELGHRSAYITMVDLLRLVADGEDVEVIEDTTGKDLTAYTFARLVFDRCRMDKDAFKAEDIQKLLMKNPPPPAPVVVAPEPKKASAAAKKAA